MMTIYALLHDLRKAKPDAIVMFDFCNCVPTTVGSWRGVYAEPALGWIATGYSGNGHALAVTLARELGVREMATPTNGLAPTVNDLITELERSIDGREFTGWKGGEFRYSGNNTLHIDNSGDVTNTGLVRVQDHDWRVMLHTRYEV
jgi:hypothetical protein